MFKHALTTCFFLFQLALAGAQKIRVLSLGNPVSLRGLCPVSDRVIWVSGSSGTVGLSVDGGISWKWMRVPDYENADFRDIEAFSDREALIMGITTPSVILKTRDGGQSWVPVFQDSSREMFLDAMDFSGDRGILLGDPVQGRVFLAETVNRGDSWKIPAAVRRVSGPGEAFFASSGSNIRWLPGNHFAFVSGGTHAALYQDTDAAVTLRLNQGGESTGANALAINPADPNQAYITGGDFSKDTIRSGNALYIRFHPFVQRTPHQPPHGYRSSVEYLDGHTLICCGSSGVDLSTDGGMNWKKISAGSFHVCRRAKSGTRLFLAGAQGIIARLE